MKPELHRWNNPGNSFRRDRSPVVVANIRSLKAGGKLQQEVDATQGY
jgi:hypothetical protein